MSAALSFLLARSLLTPEEKKKARRSPPLLPLLSDLFLLFLRSLSPEFVTMVFSKTVFR
jgi:hypothetical protein